jgi:hypothetical protein
MSDKQREAVEGLMQELAAGVDMLGVSGAAAGSSEGLSGGLGSGPDLQQQEQAAQEEVDCAEAASQFIDGLVRGGFSAADAAAAVKAVGVAAGMAAATAATAASAAAAAGGRRVTRVYRSHEGLQPYLDWLCIRLPVERLPSRYRPGACVCVSCVLQGREEFTYRGLICVVRASTWLVGAVCLFADK